MTRRLLLVLAGLLVVAASVVGVGGVTSMTGARPLALAVVDDDRAYLGYDPGTFDNGTWSPAVTNNFETSVTVTVAANGVVETATLAPGARATLVLDGVSCGDEVVITAVGDGVRVEMVRAVGCG